MAELEKSDVIKNLLNNLIDISGRKTTRGHAIFTLERVIKQLEDKYAFLTNVKIKDTRYIEDDDTISVMSDINVVNSSDMGLAIQDIITTMDTSLGEDAGHFFIKELRRNLSDEYVSSMDDMGVDLSLLQLEREVRNLEKSISRKTE